MLGFGPQELVMILIIVVVLFGGRKIPEIMRGLGQGLREFRQASNQATEDLKRLTEPEPETDDNDQADNSRQAG